MTTSVELFDRTTTVNPQTLAKIAFLGVAVGASANSVFDVDNPDTVASTVGGYGNLVEGAAAAIRQSKRPHVAVALNPSVAAILGSLTQSGSGPVIVASGTPRDDYTLRIRIKQGGALGVSRFDWSLDGGNYQGEDYTPTESSATVTGNVDVSGGASLNTLTLVFTDPAAAVITFSGSFADAEAIVTQFNTLAASSALTFGSDTSDAGSFPVSLAHGDTFVGKVDEQSVADTLTISATAASFTGSSATYAAVTPGNQLVIDIDGTQYTVTFTGSESSQATFHSTINAVIAGFGLATNSAGETKISTAHKGSSATGAIVSGDLDVLTSLGFSVASFTPGTGNVANVAAVTASEFAGLLTSTFTGGTAGSTGTAIGSDRVKWATNTAGASPNGVQFTSGSGVAKIAGFDTSEHNGTTGASLAVRARVVQGRYIQLYTTATGSGVQLTVSASSSADTVLGLANTPATGDDATFSPPNTGITHTFPTGTYVEDEVYAWPCTGPRFDKDDITDGMDALLADTTKTWDDIVILGVPADGTETKAWADAIKAKLLTWRGTDPKRSAFVFFPSSLGGTGISGVTTNDTDVKTKMLTLTDEYQCCVHGDGYGLGTEFPGKLRRPLVHAVGVLAASRRFSADLGSRDFPEIPEWDMTAPDGVTKARDENTATVKMYSRQSPGQRFTVCKQEKSLPYIVKGVSRAATTSKFRHVGVIRMGRAALNIGYEEARKLENTDPPLNGQGKLRPPQAKSKATAIKRRFESELVDPGHASAVRIQLDTDEQVSTTDNITINGEILPNGQAESVTFNIGVVSELTLA